MIKPYFISEDFMQLDTTEAKDIAFEVITALETISEQLHELTKLLPTPPPTSLPVPTPVGPTIADVLKTVSPHKYTGSAAYRGVIKLCINYGLLPQRSSWVTITWAECGQIPITTITDCPTWRNDLLRVHGVGRRSWELVVSVFEKLQSEKQP